ncbi:hypothetical protein [Brevibacterium marinum]|uniref:Lipoprotein n=1 Tax=Brevibacterium marinum TaxID=418643 RepID=A0A846S4X9_9MICO|nr:hypothetical protein [Brevibacterium marinum]NJC58073.1 hypothetical protein [Brevibacterium marinum]
MMSVPRGASALIVAFALALGGCSSPESETSDIEAGQAAEVPSSDFDSTDEVGDFLNNTIDDAHVHRESESNPDFAHETDADRLHVEFPSEGMLNTDKKATADAVQAAGSATFDYDVLMVTGSTDTGTWSYIYSAETVEAMTKDDSPVEADTVWESADQDFDSVHR